MSPVCRWGDGCPGILDEPAEHLQQGCCSVGAELLDEDEAMLIAALTATLGPDRFEHHAEAGAGGVYADDTRGHTRVVDGACIFFNRPGFAGGVGCALRSTTATDRWTQSRRSAGSCRSRSSAPPTRPVRCRCSGDGSATTGARVATRWPGAAPRQTSASTPEVAVEIRRRTS